jgi:hypothetical protein
MTSTSSTEDTTVTDREAGRSGGHNGGHDGSDDLIVGVRFELSRRAPLAKAYPPSTTVATVLGDAMNHFKVQPDPNTTYYLTADRIRRDGITTLAEVAGDRDELEFRLVKELIQGGQ